MKTAKSTVSVAGQVAPGPAGGDGAIRANRDRFVAFAFCDADILIELDRAQIVTFAAGATKALLTVEPAALVGRDIFELISEDQHKLLREILRMAETGSRIEPVLIRLRGEAGDTPPLSLSGFHLADMAGHYFLALRMGLPAPTPIPVTQGNRQTESGLFDAESFSEIAGGRVKAIQGSGESYRYSVFKLGGFSELRTRLDEERRAQLLSTIGESLRAGSLYGDSAGQLDDDRFGLIHADKTDVGRIQSEIERSARVADPQRQGIHIHAASVDLDCDGMSESDAVNALVYTIGRLGDDERPADIRSLSQGLTAMVTETAQEMASARAAVEQDRFDMVYQPIVEIDSSKIFYFEVLSRFSGSSTPKSPSDFFRFAEEVGIVRELDLACCRRAIETLSKAKRSARLSVNLSGDSLRDEGFVQSLMTLLNANQGLADRLFFDIKEKSIISDLPRVNRIIGELRRRGHKVCVDNFGAGASVLHYLRDIEVDMVKIDSRYIKDVVALSNGEAFLKAIAGLCEYLGIDTIASMVEHSESLEMVRQAGIRYAQGYYLGEPQADADLSRTKID